MLEKKLLLDNIDKVRGFVAVSSSKDYEIELVNERYVVNAKSIAGLFALDLTKPVTMVAHCDTAGELIRQITPYLYEKGDR